MKKILAIALAVVMVLSMASAFALDWPWNCEVTSAKNGKATIEVIPYVKINTSCDTWKWVQSSCAAAVGTENVYFVVKLTVPADVNPIWYKHASAVDITGTKDGFFKGAKVDGADLALPAITYDDDVKGDGWVFYAIASETQIAADHTYPVASTTTVFKWATSGTGATAKMDQSADNSAALTEPDDVMNRISIYNASKAKLCAEFVSNFSGMGEWLTYGQYAIYVESNPEDGNEASSTSFVPATITIINDCNVASADRAFATVTPNTRTDSNMGSVANVGSQKAVFTIDPTSKKVITVAGATGTSLCDPNFVSVAKAYFNLDVDTCVNAKNVKANFGWKDTVTSCYTWSSNATAIVDVQCEVEIPKTGDVSVIAYAVMAVVAAAGAMGLKK